MRLKSICLAGATLLAVALPAAASADPYWDHDGWRAHEWREHQWREHEAWERRGWDWRDAPRCFVEDRGHYDWYGNYVYQPVRVCVR